jgi:hypothetical protein
MKELEGILKKNESFRKRLPENQQDINSIIFFLRRNGCKHLPDL